MEQETINYQRITNAIDYIRGNFKNQPSLEEIAEVVHLSPFYFQKLFTEWAGVSPKKFMRFISLEYAKSLLKEQGATLFETTHETGLSSTGRLHDLFINLQGMTPAEYKNGGQNLSINYSFAESPFGNLIVGSTSKGVCHMAFAEDNEEGIKKLHSRFPNAQFQQVVDIIQQEALFIFQHDWNKLNQIKLHLHGTPFQLQVWQALLSIPMGKVSTYGELAKSIGRPKASRAVGSAIGSNPVAYLIPCHRVIQGTGKFGGYMWGESRKTALLGWEFANS